VKPKKILVAHSDEEFSQSLTILLKAQGYQVVSAPDAVSAISTARREQPDLAVLDAALPGGGLGTAERMRLLPDIDPPKMIFLGPSDRRPAGDSSFISGAEAYLSKPVDIHFLVRCVDKALGTGTVPAAPGDLPPTEGSEVKTPEGPAPGDTRGDDHLIDEMTGLCGREAFFVLAEHQIRVSNRTKKGLALMLLRLGNLSSIKDSLGPLEAEHAVAQTARTLRESFRGSDIVAHMGGGEFAVLALEAKSVSRDLLARRLYKNLKHLNSETVQRYHMAVKAALVCYDPLHPVPLAELLRDGETALAKEVQE
jgi:diguanylate cyclase (GGDEF)-like protein